MARKFDRMPDLPATVDDAKVEEFMEHYYALSNDSTDHQGFADMFVEDGEYSMNDKITKGREDIKKLREAMFAHIPDRDHYPIQIYTHGHDQMQLMARGKVEYRHHAGHETDSEWAAYYELIEEDGQIKFKKIHIIVDSGAHV